MSKSNPTNLHQLELHQIKLNRDKLVLLDDLNCAFNAGQFWGVIGQNGSGKSTLLHAMAGLNQPSGGYISIDGKNLKTLKPLQRARKISLLLQDQEPSLAVSVQDAVAMGRYAWRQKDANNKNNDITENILSNCRIEHLKERSILRLSGGERRKVEIATCLAQHADFLLLDEPLNHLDLVYQAHILEQFKQISQHRCVVMVCHDLAAVREHCTHVLMLMSSDCHLWGTSATILNDENLKQLFDEPIMKTANKNTV